MPSAVGNQFIRFQSIVVAPAIFITSCTNDVGWTDGTNQVEMDSFAWIEGFECSNFSVTFHGFVVRTRCALP